MDLSQSLESSNKLLDHSITEVIAALSLVFQPSKQDVTEFLSISFLHDIYHQCTSINFNRHFKFIQFYLPEVIIYHCVHLMISQQSILVVIHSLSILSFCGIPYHYTFSMTPTPNLSGILYTVMCVLIDVAFVCFCVFCI